MRLSGQHLSFLLIILFGITPALAFGQPNIYANPQNLKVLPEDISADELRATMRSFALDTGFRCSDCHVGSEGQPLPEYDFASDEKPHKATARLMLKMVNDINGTYLRELGKDRVKVWCVSCHRGVNKPRMIGDVLAEAADESGVEGIRTSYAELREKYYGSHSYDFGVMSLSEFARSRAHAGKMDEARATLDIVIKDNPGSFMVHYTYGELLLEAGQGTEAAGHYRRAMELNPDAAGFLQKRIEQAESL
jgi:tetratricopeptide (TPR) repeat protein